MVLFRRIVSCVLGAAALLMLVTTLTVPAIVAAGPAVLTLLFAGVSWVVWP